MTLRFRATDETSGTLSYTNREFRTCNDVTQVCPAVPDVPASWTGGSIVAR
jgi:hypothetical protein